MLISTLGFLRALWRSMGRVETDTGAGENHVAVFDPFDRLPETITDREAVLVLIGLRDAAVHKVIDLDEYRRRRADVCARCRPPMTEERLRRIKVFEGMGRDDGISQYHLEMTWGDLEASRAAADRAADEVRRGDR